MSLITWGLRWVATSGGKEKSVQVAAAAESVAQVPSWAPVRFAGIEIGEVRSLQDAWTLRNFVTVGQNQMHDVMIGRPIELAIYIGDTSGSFINLTPPKRYTPYSYVVELFTKGRELEYKLAKGESYSIPNTYRRINPQPYNTMSLRAQVAGAISLLDSTHQMPLVELMNKRPPISFTEMVTVLGGKKS